MGFLFGLAGKELTCIVGDLGSIPGLGRYPGEGKGYSLQDSGLENSMDCIVHEVAESEIAERLSLFTLSVHSWNKIIIDIFELTICSQVFCMCSPQKNLTWKNLSFILQMKKPRKEQYKKPV